MENFYNDNINKLKEILYKDIENKKNEIEKDFENIAAQSLDMYVYTNEKIENFEAIKKHLAYFDTKVEEIEKMLNQFKENSDKYERDAIWKIFTIIGFFTSLIVFAGSSLASSRCSWIVCLIISCSGVFLLIFFTILIWKTTKYAKK